MHRSGPHGEVRGILIAPRVPALQVPGGRDFVYPKQLDRARRNLKPTPLDPFSSK